MASSCGPFVAFIRERIKLTASNFYQREFGSDKKAVQRHKSSNGCELGNEYNRRVPVVGNAITDTGCGQKANNGSAHQSDATWHPNPPSNRLPARFGNAGNQSAGRQLAEGEAGNLKPADKGTAATGYLTTVNNSRWTRVTRQLRKASVIFLCLELCPQRSIFLGCIALALVAVDPGGFRHKGTRKVAEKPWSATRFSTHCGSLRRTNPRRNH